MSGEELTFPLREDLDLIFFGARALLNHKS